MITFCPASVVAVRVGPFHHVGILTGPLGSTIISSSRRRGYVAEEAPEDFLGGLPIEFQGYLGTLAPQEVIARARSRLGAKWDLLTANCEHLVTWAHGLEPRSPQLQLTIGAVGLVGIVGAYLVMQRSA